MTRSTQNHNTQASSVSSELTPKAKNGFISTANHNGSSVATNNIYNTLSHNLNSLAESFDALHNHAVQVALLGGKIGNEEQVHEFRQQIRDQDLRHKEGLEEIQNIIDDILRNEGDDMRMQVNQELADQIDEIVKEQVAQCLKDHIPEDLQLELAENKREYEELQRALHNSESRRLNATLRADNPDVALHTIQMIDGNISPLYPKDLKELFTLDTATLETLMSEYEIAGKSSSGDANLNKFMQFCGVRYQLVVKPNAAKHNNASTAI